MENLVKLMLVYLVLYIPPIISFSILSYVQRLSKNVDDQDRNPIIRLFY